MFFRCKIKEILQMAITIAVQNNKVMQCYAKLKKQLQQDNVIRVYKLKRYHTTAQQLKKVKISMRVMRAKALKVAQARNVSSAS